MRYIKYIVVLIFVISTTTIACSADISTENIVGEKMPKLLLSSGEKVWSVTLYDNVASRDLLKLLPLTLTFSDYNSIEKYAHLPRQLSTAGLPSGYDPSFSDFAFYAPWGNLIIYYKDFSYSSGIISLGRIDSGAEEFINMNKDFTMTIKVIE